jgi:uncharacterized protein YacL
LPVLFIEALRLILVIFGAVAGYMAGRAVNWSVAPAVGLILGGLIFYVVGGVAGRFLNRQKDLAAEPFARVPPGEFFAGSLTALGGMIIGGALCVPLVALVDSPLVYPTATLVVSLLGWAGFRVGVVKGRQVVAAAGLTRILAPPTAPPADYALVVDASALMDRSLLVLGRAGLLVGGLVIPRFVIDHVKAIASAPDPVASRRARRGLEALEAMREMGVSVNVAENELPEIDDLNDRLIEICRRLGLRLATCSKGLYERAEQRGIRATELRRVASEMSPDFPPGEKLIVDLVKAGNQPRQAVGYLPDGDMVVVNDAAQAVGREGVIVEVQSTRVTGQGRLVFARLADSRAAGLNERGATQENGSSNGNKSDGNSNGHHHEPEAGAAGRAPAAPTTPR